MAHLAAEDKNSAVYLIQNIKYRHGYNVTCNPCNVQLNTTSKLWNCWITKPQMSYTAAFWCDGSCSVWLKHMKNSAWQHYSAIIYRIQNTMQILRKSSLQISRRTLFWHNLRRGRRLRDELSKNSDFFGIIQCLFELCRLPQRSSLTLHPLGGSTPCMWPLFLLRAKGKRKEMTGTQHVGTLKHQFLQYITKKNVLVLFHCQNNFEMNSSSAIWWRHLPVACNNFFEAGVSGNRGISYPKGT
jgi:hypothetical protein